MPREMSISATRLLHRDRAPLLLTLIIVVTYAVAVGLVGHSVMDPAWASSALERAGVSGVELGFWPIVATNGAAALLLFSGTATAGLSTLAALTWTSAYVGATMSVAAANVGWVSVLSQVWMYLPFELAGLAFAAVAGLYPLVLTMAPRRDSRASGVGRYLAGCRSSLRLLLASGLALSFAAFLEVLTGA